MSSFNFSDPVAFPFLQNQKDLVRCYATLMKLEVEAQTKNSAGSDFSSGTLDVLQNLHSKPSTAGIVTFKLAKLDRSYRVSIFERINYVKCQTRLRKDNN
ncbi:hypothetical protein RvY_08768 [Ramazzottius varieornatus]|uniref:Uncharacterized protein n=1 Tax=Ramazzottius varieornatus TaxID=947166 RepID=A0A1D1V753_RAMVA|nr:hypothetical protein RvY_08768 [Ramazzottius varieornatus]